MDKNIGEIFNRLKEESDGNINWTLALDSYILKVLPIESLDLIWVISSEKQVFLIDKNNGKIIMQFDNIADLIFSALVHPITQQLFIGSSNGVFILDFDGTIKQLVSEHGWFEHLSISNDGAIFFVSKGKTLYILKQKNNSYQLVKKDTSFRSSISNIIFSHDSFLVSNYGSIREYTMSDLKNHTIYECKTSILSTSWSPDMKYIVASTQENAFHFWSYPFEHGKDFIVNGYQSKITSMIWSNNATELVVNNFEDIHIWDFSEGSPTSKGPLTLRCGFGKIIDIYYKKKLLVAATEKGFIFCFIPNSSERFTQIQSVDGEITCILINEDESKLFVGTKSGNLYSLNIKK